MTATSANPLLSTAPSAAPGGSPLVTDLAALTRPDFPLLDQTACLGQPLIYLDYAATSQKPRQVLEALQQYYGHDNANVHRGAHQLSARATEGFEAARDKVATFIGAASPREIVFTRNASEAINLVARTWGEAHLGEGRRGAAHGDGTPQQPGALATAGGPHRLCAAPCRRDRER